MPQLGFGASRIYPDLAAVGSEVAATEYYVDLTSGTSDYLTGATSSDIFSTGDCSLSFWFNASSFANLNFIHMTDNPGAAPSSDAFSIYTDVSGDLIVRIMQGRSSLYLETIAAPFSGAGWHHVAFAFDRDSSFRVFIDNSTGTTVSQTDSGADISVTGALEVGRRNSGAVPTYSTYSIDNLAFWNTLVTPAAVGDIYAAGVTTPLDLSAASGNYTSGMASGLVAWYQMGDGTEAAAGTTVYDMSGSSVTPNDLTMTGSPAFTAH